MHENVFLADGDKKPGVINKKLFDAATKHLHSKDELEPAMINDKPVKALSKATEKILLDALDFGIKDNEVPEAMLEKLRNDVFVFSGFKTYAQLKTASEFLLTEDGKRKPFAQFAKDIEGVHKYYNQQYLEAEYYFAQGSAQMAAKWADLDSDGRYNLQYRTAGDSRVRDTHAALRDTTLPADDEFWDSYYPPNGWRCRCQAVEVSKEKYPASDAAAAKQAGEAATTMIGRGNINTLAIFRFNPGKQQVIFPPRHPYKGNLDRCGQSGTGAGQNEKCEVNDLLQKQLKK